MPYTTVPEAVQTMADHFDTWEKWAAKAKKNAREMKQGFAIIHAEGALGGLESLAMATALDALATQQEADIYAMHAKLTEQAKELGIDLPQRDGGR